MPVDLTRDGDAAVITLNRPEALNALSFDIIRDIGAAIDAAAATDARILIFTGAGKRAFCAGADIKELRDQDTNSMRTAMKVGQDTFAKLDTLAKPSLALINGYAFGGGLELALACTFRVATPNAKVGLPEIKLGIIPGYGGTQRLPRLVGEGRALEMIMTGRTVDAEEAERIGLVHRIVDGMDGARDFAAAVTCYSLPVLDYAREAVMTALDNPIPAGLKVERDLNVLAFTTDDCREGMAAFEEKRKANFTDA
ncbi:MAG: enoyl-CoA hydratase-related protein [Rhodospirillaceae bacterium]